MSPGIFHTAQQRIGMTNVGAMNVGSISVARMLALPGFKRKPSKITNGLPVNAGQLIESVVSMLDTLVVQAIEARTASEFTATIECVFPRYYDAVLGLSHLVQVLVPKDVMEALVSESFSKIEDRFRERGLAAFGPDVRDQAIFTAWTLKKIGDLCHRINKTPLEADLNDSNSDLFKQFLFHAMCTRFSLDCLFKSMMLQKPIFPDVLPIVMDGLRNAVDCYAFVRRAFDLRSPMKELSLDLAEWDEEDDRLLNEANHDTFEAAV